ncbi:hypothetical protein Ae168Ps1_3007c [Pseudonocardia sp. Ae168_Ps1]|nr:hypothetical protein Ae168Ps1_3007c [Pseudonocardia sp. Ae168_Ps1]OLL94704.1 hypothetical protein Ae356Ps1_4601c [Pseudonocardia sp. Ae356_Ps1]
MRLPALTGSGPRLAGLPVLTGSGGLGGIGRRPRASRRSLFPVALACCVVARAIG